MVFMVTKSRVLSAERNLQQAKLDLAEVELRRHENEVEEWIKQYGRVRARRLFRSLQQ